MTSQSPFQQFSAHESQSSPQSVHDPESVEPYELLPLVLFVMILVPLVKEVPNTIVLIVLIHTS
jgi:hypothetical protein